MKKQILMYGMIIALLSMFTACTKQASLTTELDEVALLSAQSRGSGDIHVSINDLPTKAQNSIAQKYPNATILCIEKKAEGFFEVHLNNGLELKFTSTGSLFDIDAEDSSKYIALTDLSLNILSLIATNYPNAQILCAEYEEDNDIPTGNIEIYLDNGLELKFSSNGNLVDVSNNDDSGNDGGGDDGTPDQGGGNNDDSGNDGGGDDGTPDQGGGNDDDKDDDKGKKDDDDDD